MRRTIAETRIGTKSRRVSALECYNLARGIQAARMHASIRLCPYRLAIRALTNPISNMDLRKRAH